MPPTRKRIAPHLAGPEVVFLQRIPQVFLLLVVVTVVASLGSGIGFIVVVGITLAGGTAFANRGGRWYPSRLFLLAVVAVVVGAIARYEVLERIYGGGGDAVRYYNAGLERARELTSLTTLPFSPAYWDLRGSRWGTSFIEQISGFVLAVIGESLRGEFVVFALFGLAGTYFIVKSYRWVNSVERSLAAAAMIWLWPSVWYWPSSVGKESLIILSMGLVAYGYVGDGTRHRWNYLVAGLGLSFLVRPHVTAVLVMSMVIANVVAPTGGRLTNRRVVQVIATALLAVIVLQGAVSRLGIEDTDLEGIQEFAAAAQQQTLKGGSNIGAVGGPLAPLQAVINVWARPFPWEANSLPSAAAAAEIVLLWYVVFRRRRDFWATLKYWRHHRMLRFALPLVAGYTLMIGLTFGNLGIIARQRAPIVPFLLMLLLGAEAAEVAPARSRRGARTPRRRADATVSSVPATT